MEPKYLVLLHKKISKGKLSLTIIVHLSAIAKPLYAHMQSVIDN